MRQMLTFDDVIKHHKVPDFSYVPLEQATEYSAGDAHQTYKLTRLLEAKIGRRTFDKRAL